MAAAAFSASKGGQLDLVSGVRFVLQSSLFIIEAAKSMARAAGSDRVPRRFRYLVPQLNQKVKKSWLTHQLLNDLCRIVYRAVWRPPLNGQLQPCGFNCVSWLAVIRSVACPLEMGRNDDEEKTKRRPISDASKCGGNVHGVFLSFGGGGGYVFWSPILKVNKFHSELGNKQIVNYTLRIAASRKQHFSPTTHSF